MGTRTTSACLLSAGLLLAGCGGGGAKAAAPTTSATTRSAVATETPTSSPSSTPAATTSPAPLTPEEKINKIADQKGWVLDDGTDDSDDAFGDDTPLYDSPAAFVQDICDSLPDQADSGPAQWLAENQATDPDAMSILTTGIPLLCPEWSKTVKQAASGKYPVFIGEGTFRVTSKRADDAVPPGTYRTTGDLSGCYWERTKANGDIIDNNFATHASRITVTIRASDDSFTSQDCGTWKPVG